MNPSKAWNAKLEAGIFLASTGSVRAVANGRGAQFLADHLSLSELGGSDYAHQITTCPPPGFLDLATAVERIIHDSRFSPNS